MDHDLTLQLIFVKKNMYSANGQIENNTSEIEMFLTVFPQDLTKSRKNTQPF